ncbi:MAG: S8 family serine peptidase [Candidatus Marinimicrobia bacterium]|nr:S8 family serine peptidase [Candidatus Neomarinimicrobiota bacterium]
MKPKPDQHIPIITLSFVLNTGLLVLFCFQLSLPVWAGNSDEDQQKVWIYLDEKQIGSEDFIPLDVQQRTLNRLLKKSLITRDHFSDGVPGNNIRSQIEQYVTEIVFYSRSLKAYSAYIIDSDITYIKSLPFIKTIEPVKFYRRKTPLEPLNKLEKSTGSFDFYGNSYDQLQQLNIPEVHDSGYTGAGVRIAIIDAGFNKEHSAFQYIIDNDRLIAEWDFIFKDNNVQDEISADTTSYPQSRHGTSVWSVIGGYVPDVLIGAAYGAEFLLAKSERIGSESILEEDLFVAAVEWADENGADIITSSVAYRDFDNGIGDYQLEQLDGKTTNAAKAINWAFERGILSVICTGNELQYFPQDGGLLTPSDAYGALGVGAVDRNGQIASFSGHGPTADGRIKPDLCALGVDVYNATIYTPNSYSYSNGTSFSTPLVAGSAALLMEKYPSLPPIKIIELLKSKSNRSSTPSDRYGWGIPDVYRSMFEYDSTRISFWEPDKARIYALPNPAITGVTFAFRWTHVIPTETQLYLKIYNLLGQLVWSTNLVPQIAGNDEFTYWNLRNFSGDIVPSGVYIVAVKDKHTTIRGKCLILH